MSIYGITCTYYTAGVSRYKEAVALHIECTLFLPWLGRANARQNRALV